jgi:chemotaxis response regulator CheB
MGEKHVMPPRQVLVLSHRSLYAEAIAELLRQQCRLEVSQVGATLCTARKRVRQANPDAILVDSLDAGLNPDALLPLLSQEMPNLQIICLAFGNECSRTCPARVKRVNTKAELLTALGECTESGADTSKMCAENPENSEHASPPGPN